ncbi:MAG: ABC transporter substrate-binding protein [Bacteroidota bacterium]
MIKNYLIIITLSILFIKDIYAQENGLKTDSLVKIGLLISNSTSISARNGAELAINKANNLEGPNGINFELVVRSMEGPWGTGSKEAVNLVFNEKVWAILGSHDGRNAHLVEQVIAKTHIVFLSAWASDPTLYQAFVPWFFSVVPNDFQQADVLINEIYHKKKWNKITTLSDNSYDSNLALQSFLKQMNKTGKVEIIQLIHNNTNKNFKELFNKINENEVDCIVLFGEPSSSFTLIQQLQKNRIIKPVYGTLSLLKNDRSDDIDFEQLQDVKVITYGNRLNAMSLSFVNAYKEKYGKIPGAVATYAYDGINSIIEAIRNSNYDREKIQEAMSKIRYKSVTGTIQFDSNGSRINSIELIKINNETPISTEK